MACETGALGAVQIPSRSKKFGDIPFVICVDVLITKIWMAQGNVCGVSKACGMDSIA